MNSDLAQELLHCLKSYADFPKPGILFRDLSPVLRNAPLSRKLFRSLCETASSWGAEQIIGVESRGFLFGVPVALELGIPFSMVRKSGKLPGNVHQVKYALEYGHDTLELQSEAVTPPSKQVIVDDVLATGGTAQAVVDLVNQAKGNMGGLLFIIELNALNGRKLLTESGLKAPIHALLHL